jgi:hypothetical protein
MFSRLNEISDWRTDYKSLRNGKMEDEKNVEAYVVQRYLLHPLLIGMMRQTVSDGDGDSHDYRYAAAADNDYGYDNDDDYDNNDDEDL